VGGCKNCGRIHSFLLHVSLIVEEICSYKTLEFPYQTVRGHDPNKSMLMFITVTASNDRVKEMCYKVQVSYCGLYSKVFAVSLSAL